MMAKQHAAIQRELEQQIHALENQISTYETKIGDQTNTGKLAINVNY